MEEEEITTLKRQREALDKEIQSKQWLGFKRRFKEMSWFEKVGLIIGLIVLFGFLVAIGWVLGDWVRYIISDIKTRIA